MSIPQEYLNIGNDFGFTATDDPFQAEEMAKSEAEVLAKRLTDVEKLIMPLLVNLTKNPEKEYILWPNRKAQIDVQIEKLLKLTRG